MTTAQVVETSVSVNNNSLIQDYVYLDDQTRPTFEMTPVLKPFTVKTFYCNFQSKAELFGPLYGKYESLLIRVSLLHKTFVLLVFICWLVWLFVSQEEDNVPDRFVIYGEEYKKIREAMAKTVLGGTNRELTDALKV